MMILAEKRPGKTPKRRPPIATRQQLQVPKKRLSWLDQYLHRDSILDDPDDKHKDSQDTEEVM
jgi:hypothetical protein